MRKPRLREAVAEALAAVPSGGTAFVAVSGGLDSMALLHLLREAASLRSLVALHVNHGLRGEESERDEAFVRAECARLQVECRVKRLDWSGTRPSQAACRERRLAFFRGVVGEADRLFLAHHLDDQAETVLQRLFRGSGLQGLAAMRPSSGRLLRPLLAFTRAEIRAYAEEAGLLWREDSSNASVKYERNWIRLELIPALEKRRPNLSRRLAALADEAAALPRATAPLSCFPLEHGNALYRARELSGAGPARLAEAFRFSRRHTEGLCALLKKGSGRYSAPGLGLRLSAGLLLAEKRPFVPERQWREEGGIWRMDSLLGRWELKLRADERAGPASELKLGEKAKKEFQEAGVPVFFREMVPLLVREGRPTALVGKKAGDSLVRLGALGRWWLTQI